MRKKLLFPFCCAVLWATPPATQERSSGPTIEVPRERGVYYRGPEGLAPLPGRLFMPMHDGILKDMLALGPPGLLAVLPGASAAVAIAETRPTFYLRGDRPGNRIYLVKGARKQDHREFRFNRGRDIGEWIRFRRKDLTELDVQPVSPGLVALRPRSDLLPGEYVIVAVLEPRFHAIRLAFDFGVTRAKP
jgi:hypothetical protein